MSPLLLASILAPPRALAADPAFEPILEDPAFENLFQGTILVTRGDAELLAVSRGTDRSGRPASQQTAYWLGSISKPIAAAAVLSELAARGRSIEEPVAAFVDEWPPDALRRDGVDCTVELLLSHQCGLPRDVGEARADIHRDRAAEQAFLEQLEGAKLTFTPGTDYEYSNVGFGVAGVLASRLAGVPYSDVVQQLLAPRDIDDLADRIAPGHFDVPWGRLSSERWLQIPWDAPSRVGASGDAFSTAPELTRWFRALVGGRVLDAGSTTEMLAPRRDDYGLGLVIEDRTSGRLVWHNGALSPHGHNAFVGHVAETDTTVAVLVNRGREVVSATRIGLALVDRAHGLDVPSPLAVAPHVRLTAGLQGAFFVGMTVGALLWCLVLPWRPGKDGVVGWTSHVVTTISTFVVVQAQLDTFRPSPVWVVPLALAVEIGVLFVGARRWPDQPVVAPGRERSAWLGALLTVGVLTLLAGALGALPTVAAILAVGLLAIGLRTATKRT